MMAMQLFILTLTNINRNLAEKEVQREQSYQLRQEEQMKAWKKYVEHSRSF